MLFNIKANLINVEKLFNKKFQELFFVSNGNFFEIIKTFWGFKQILQR